MDKYVSDIQGEIIKALAVKEEGYSSLFRLAVEIEHDYRIVWRNMLTLCLMGVITARRGTMRGRGYHVCLSPKFQNFLGRDQNGATGWGSLGQAQNAVRAVRGTQDQNG